MKTLLRKCGTNTLLRKCGTNTLLIGCPPPAPCICPGSLADTYTVLSGSHWREEFADPANNYFDIVLLEDGLVSNCFAAFGTCNWQTIAVALPPPCDALPTGLPQGHLTAVIGGVTIYDADTAIGLTLTLGTINSICQWNIAAAADAAVIAIPYNLKAVGLTPIGNYAGGGFNDGAGTFLGSATVTA